MTIRQRFFYIIGVYTFCGVLRTVNEEIAKSTIKKLEEARAEAKVKKEADVHIKEARHQPNRYASN